MQEESDQSRRSFLKTASGGAGTVGIVALAGCTGGNGDDPDGTPSGGDDVAQEDRFGGTLNVLIRGNPPNLFSANNGSVASSQVLSPVGDSWAQYDYEENTLGPRSLEDWEWLDDTTLQCTVREGMQFHQGYGEVTAEDFVYLTNLIIDEPLAQFFLWTDRVDGAEVVDDYVFNINLNRTFGPFEFTVLATTRVHSKAAIEDRGLQGFGQNPVMNGPYQFEEWVDGSFLRLSRFDDYHGTPGYPDEIVYEIVPESSTRLDMLSTGEADVANRAPYRDLDALDRDEGMQVLSRPGWHFDYMLVGGDGSDVDALKERPVRRAISYAIDRQAIVDNAYYGYAVPDDDPLPPTHDPQLPDGDVEVFPNTADPDTALQLLDEAGYGDGFEFTLVHSNRTQMARASQIVQSSLREVGLDVSLQQVDTATHGNISTSGNYDVAYGDITIMSPDADAATYWFWHDTGILNTMGYRGFESADRVTELLDAQRDTTDQQARGEMLQELIELAVNDAPMIYTLHAEQPRIMRTGVHLDTELLGRDRFAPRDDVWDGLRYVWIEDR